MANIHSNDAVLSASYNSTAEHMSAGVKQGNTYADLNDNCCRKITELERSIAEETGEQVALVAYKL